MFSNPGPDGTNEEHWPWSPWNSFAIKASKAYLMGLMNEILTGYGSESS